MTSDPTSTSLDDILDTFFFDDTDKIDYIDAKNQAKSRILALLAQQTDKAIRDYIKPHLDYCQEVNGRRSCKNCQLSELQTKGDKDERR